MAINLEKGQRIDLTKKGGAELTQFCVGVNWGAIEKKKKSMFGFGKEKTVKEAVDLDLSCLILDNNGEAYDHIYSPLYDPKILQKIGLPAGKLQSMDGALTHSGDDLEGDLDGDDGLDNEIISVNLTRINANVGQIFFFINNVGKEDFAQIPFAKIRMYEGTPTSVKEIHATYDVVTDGTYSGKRAMVMGKLYRRDGKWKFAAIGDATDDASFAHSIHTILSKYAK